MSEIKPLCTCDGSFHKEKKTVYEMDGTSSVERCYVCDVCGGRIL